jgi:hypothetical protein
LKKISFRSLTFVWMHVYCLFAYLFWVKRAIFQLSGDCHHCRRQDCKFRPMLSAYGFSSEGSFTCPTYCDTGPPFLRSYPKHPWFNLLNPVLLAKEQSLPIFKRLRFDAAGPSGARTHDVPLMIFDSYPPWNLKRLNMALKLCCDLGFGFSKSHPKTAPFSRLLRHTRGCGECILTGILTGPHMK